MSKETIQFTKDYDRFVFGDDNRDTQRPHVKELIGSMERNGFLKSKAISVQRIPGSSKLKVVDGQHRLLAAQELGIQVWFKIDDSITDDALPDMQIAKKWTPEDYLKHFLAKGKPNFNMLSALSAQFPKVAISSIVLLLRGGVSEEKYMDDFRAGKIKISHLKQATEALQLATDLENIYHHHWVHGRTFLSAFIQILALPGYDHKMMLHKLKMRSEEFTQMMSEEGYFKMFDKIYNYKAVTNRIVFIYIPRPKSKAGRKKSEEND